MTAVLPTDTLSQRFFDRLARQNPHGLPLDSVHSWACPPLPIDEDEPGQLPDDSLSPMGVQAWVTALDSHAAQVKARFPLVAPPC